MCNGYCTKQNWTSQPGCFFGEWKEYDRIGREHFNKFCSHCPTAFDINSSWHEGNCTKFNKNPYIKGKS